jgi:cytochrome c oxidase subunit 1
VLFGGAVFGLFAGFYYWWPKVFGRMLDETWGKVNFWLMFIGMNLTFFPMHFLGLHGMPRRTFTYAAGLGFEQWNMVSTIGSYMIAVGTLVFAWNLIVSHRRGAIAGANPWGAATLEWSIPSPPAEYNFRHIPVVRSRMPLWETDPAFAADVPHGKHEEDFAEVDFAGHKIGEMEFPDSESKMSAHDLGIHLPPPSLLPILLALALAVFFGSFVLRMWQIPVLAGVAIAVLIYAFAFEKGHSGH